jgi:hypothetical protein
VCIDVLYGEVLYVRLIFLCNRFGILFFKKGTFIILCMTPLHGNDTEEH